MNLSLGHAHTPALHRSCIFLGWWKQTSQKEQSQAGDVLYLKVHQREYEPSVTSQKCGSHFSEHGGEQWELDLARYVLSEPGSSPQNSFPVTYRDFVASEMTSLGRTQTLMVATQSANNTMSKLGVKFRWIVRGGCRKREITGLQGGTHL